MQMSRFICISGFQFRRAGVLDEREIEEGDPAAPVEQLVARVRVAVEGADPVKAAEYEPVDRLGGQVAFWLRPAREFGEAAPSETSEVIIRPVDSSLMTWRTWIVGCWR
jgi:hypothetical protein